MLPKLCRHSARHAVQTLYHMMPLPANAMLVSIIRTTRVCPVPLPPLHQWVRFRQVLASVNLGTLVHQPRIALFVREAATSKAVAQLRARSVLLEVSRPALAPSPLMLAPLASLAPMLQPPGHTSVCRALHTRSHSLQALGVNATRATPPQVPQTVLFVWRAATKSSQVPAPCSSCLSVSVLHCHERAPMY